MNEAPGIFRWSHESIESDCNTNMTNLVDHCQWTRIKLQQRWSKIDLQLNDESSESCVFDLPRKLEADASVATFPLQQVKQILKLSVDLFA